MSIQRKTIDTQIQQLEKRTGMKFHLSVHNLDRPMYRLETADETRDISPRLNCHDMHEWLDGFRCCFEEMERQKSS